MSEQEQEFMRFPAKDTAGSECDIVLTRCDPAETIRRSLCRGYGVPDDTPTDEMPEPARAELSRWTGLVWRLDVDDHRGRGSAYLTDRLALAQAIAGDGYVILNRDRAERLIAVARNGEAFDLGLDEPGAMANVDFVAASEGFSIAIKALQLGDLDPLPDAASVARQRTEE